MVEQYAKLNQRTKPHAGSLPNMEEMVENLAKCRFKSKMDLRSGFWQIGLSDRAKELTAFTIPNGRCFRWLCMPFGLQGAPGVFQEMMELLVQKVKMSPLAKKLFCTRIYWCIFRWLWNWNTNRRRTFAVAWTFVESLFGKPSQDKTIQMWFSERRVGLSWFSYWMGYLASH